MIDWLEIHISRQRATVILGPQQRAGLPGVLAEHVSAIEERIADGTLPHATGWLLRPHWRFNDSDVVTAVREVPTGEMRGASEPARRADASKEDPAETEDTAKRRAPRRPSGSHDTGGGVTPRDRQSSDGVPRLVGTSWPREAPASRAADTHVAMLTMDHGAMEGGAELVTVSLDLDEAGRAMWGQAALQVRPIHLRNHGYPLIGVRLVASYLGRMALIDGVVDVGSEDAGPVFAALSRRFRVQLVLAGARATSTSIIRREVSARDLERNAALCLESARAALARSEYPREAFDEALDHLREASIEDRLRGAPETLLAGSYRHLISPRETWVALEHLENASDKQNLATLLEVDGLSVDEYEAIRRRVLVASVEQGLCAPRRFWRRIIASGLADDFDDYAGRLSRARGEAESEAEGDDLEPDQRRLAWARIAELCDLKQLEYPPELSAQRGGHESSGGRAKEPDTRREQRRRRATDEAARSRSAAGEIETRGEVRRGGGSLSADLRNTNVRLRVATASLAQGGSSEAIAAVLDALDQFDEEELLALLPSLAELGTQVVPGLHGKLDSPRQQVRQASAILLGIVGDPSSIAPLIRRLTHEDSRVWFDVARAIGSIGSASLERLCALVRQSARGDAFPIRHRELLARAGRAMAEVVIADGGEDSIAHDSVETLAQSTETDISVAAGRALATLGDVSVAGAQVRGERSLPDMTQLRGFARRAYEAILVPEFEILDDEEVEVEAELIS